MRQGTGRATLQQNRVMLQADSVCCGKKDVQKWILPCNYMNDAAIQKRQCSDNVAAARQVTVDES
jgi:hypothetical protein